MKPIVLAALGLLAFSVQGVAQARFEGAARPNKPGAIQFTSTFDPAAMAAANGMKLTDEMIARMPARSSTNFELLFNTTNASYMKVDDIEDSNGGGGGGFGGGMRFGGFGGSNKDYYYNFVDHKLTEAFDLSDTTFFVEDKLGTPVSGFGNIATPVVEYIKSDQTKKILGFDCKKVIIKTTTKRKIQEEEKEITDEATVWYTNQLGFDFSPNPALWTEGAVLAIESKGNSVVAKSIEYRNVSNRDVNLPKKGTLLSADAYKAKMEARMKQMRNRSGARGQMRSMSIN